MEILSNKDKIIENARKDWDRFNGREVKDIKTIPGELDDLQSIKTLLMAILGKVRDIDVIVRQQTSSYGNRKHTFHGEADTSKLPLELEAKNGD